ncbi:MAG: hypothetical protein ACFFEV_10800 [Candidatus Thorarchaeota archaeon]
MKDISKKGNMSGFLLEYESGHMEFQARLRIILSSDKIIQWKIPSKTPLDREIEEKEGTKRETEISDEVLAAVVEELQKKKIWDLENCTDRPLPDTALLTFRIKNQNQVVYEQQVWENCRNDSKRTKELIKILASILPSDWTPP